MGTHQGRRSRAVALSANVAEAYRKRQYPNAFVTKLADADGECGDTGLVDYSRDRGLHGAAVASDRRPVTRKLDGCSAT